MAASLLLSPVFLHCRILHLIDSVPFLCLGILGRLRPVFIKKPGQVIAVYPDFVISFLLGFIKDQLESPVQMGLPDIIHIFLLAVAGVSHIADDLPGSDHTAFLQVFTVGEILPQMGVIIIALPVKAADAQPPATVLIPADGLHIAGFNADDRCTNTNTISYKIHYNE